MRAGVLAAVLALALVPDARNAPVLPKPDPDDGAILLPPGFRALVVADDLGPLRFLTVAANGDVYVKMRDGGIIALRDGDGDGRAERREHVRRRRRQRASRSATAGSTTRPTARSTAIG